MSHHMGLLSKSSVAYLTYKGFLARVYFKMLFEVESFGVDQEAAHWTTFVVRPEQRKYFRIQKL